MSMKTVSVREMKAQWAEIERQVKNGETFEVLNRGKPAALIVPTKPRTILKWPDFMATAIPGRGKDVAQIILDDRKERF